MTSRRQSRQIYSWKRRGYDLDGEKYSEFVRKVQVIEPKQWGAFDGVVDSVRNSEFKSIARSLSRTAHRGPHHRHRHVPSRPRRRAVSKPTNSHHPAVHSYADVPAPVAAMEADMHGHGAEAGLAEIGISDVRGMTPTNGSRGPSMPNPTREKDQALKPHVDGLALCLSGGGYRAVGFHLGTVEYLDRIDLLRHVKHLSTVSGGTFVGAKYVVSLMEGISFDDYFRDYYEFCDRTNLIELAFDKLNGRRPHTPSRRQTFIVSMAQVFADTFMNGPDGKPYLFRDVLEADLPFDELHFNATELHHGAAFTFRRSHDHDARIGNRWVQLDRDDIAHARLADIVASSSCFPGPYETLAFPHDWVWPEGQIPPGLERQFSKNGEAHPLPLADGCVYDNQGIETLLLHEDSGQDELDMCVISDTDPRFNELYNPPEENRKGGPIRVGHVIRLAQVLMAICAVCTVAVGVRLFMKVSTGTLDTGDLFVYVVPFFFAAIIGVSTWWVYSGTKQTLLASLPPMAGTVWKGLWRVRVRQLLDMIELRMTVLMMSGGKFNPQRIRRLVYALTYRSPKYEGKLVSNRIWELSSGQSLSADLPESVPKPSIEMRRVCDVAATLATNLWYDYPYELPCLVAAGQATTCSNVMVWLVRKYGDDPSRYPAAIRSLWDQLLDDWKKLVADPYALLAERLPNASLARPPKE